MNFQAASWFLERALTTHPHPVKSPGRLAALDYRVRCGSVVYAVLEVRILHIDIRWQVRPAGGHGHTTVFKVFFQMVTRIVDACLNGAM